MQLSLAKQEDSSFFASIASAAEEDYQTKDELQIMYDNQVAEDNPDRAIVFEYVSAKDDLMFFQDLAAIMEIVVKGDPENQEAREFLADIGQTTTELKNTITIQGAKVEQMDILDSKEPEEENGSYLLYILIPLVIVVGLASWQKDRILGIFKKQKF